METKKIQYLIRYWIFYLATTYFHGTLYYTPTSALACEALAGDPNIFSENSCTATLTKWMAKIKNGPVPYKDTEPFYLATTYLHGTLRSNYFRP